MNEKIKEMMSLSNNKKEKMTMAQAFETVEEWADVTGSNLYGDDLDEIKDDLWRVIVDEKLKIDDSKKSFTYVLSEPILDREGRTVFSVIKINKAKISGLIESEKIKGEIESNLKNIQAHVSGSDGENIELGYMLRLEPRDVKIISKVVSSFFY